MNGGPVEVKGNLRDNLVYFPVDALKQAERKSTERTARIWELIDVYRHRLNVTNWDLRYNPSDQPRSGSQAEISYQDMEMAAVITIREDVPFEALEAVVAHEVLHVATRQLWLAASHLLIHVADDTARVHLTEQLDDALEATVETIARALDRSHPRVIPDGNWDEADRKLWAPFIR